MSGSIQGGSLTFKLSPLFSEQQEANQEDSRALPWGLAGKASSLPRWELDPLLAQEEREVGGVKVWRVCAAAHLGRRIPVLTPASGFHSCEGLLGPSPGHGGARLRAGAPGCFPEWSFGRAGWLGDSRASFLGSWTCVLRWVKFLGWGPHERPPWSPRPHRLPPRDHLLPPLVAGSWVALARGGAIVLWRSGVRRGTLKVWGQAGHRSLDRKSVV